MGWVVQRSRFFHRWSADSTDADLCDDEFHDKWLQVFAQVHSIVVYVVGWPHMWGILADCQVVNVRLHGILGFVLSLVGLGILHRAIVGSEPGDISMTRAIAVWLPETVPSLFALTFAHADAASQQKQFLSLAVSWRLSLSQKCHFSRAGRSSKRAF